ncbi:hypothetical protein SPHINGOT1_110088 [Sphingomonas sp. T1]|nr:hypothetical protein SPHINGOT1_110088 [Sphingomonas sp. T1]
MTSVATGAGFATCAPTGATSAAVATPARAKSFNDMDFSPEYDDCYTKV